MTPYQPELDFVSPEEKAARSKRADIALSKIDDTDVEWYRINKYADWWCDHVPRCIGYGVWDKYRDTRLWIKSTYQKLRYGVSDEECWNLYHTISRYILPRLKHFKNMKRMGVPCTLDTKWHPIDESDVSQASKEWEAILDELIWTFEYINEEDDQLCPIPEFTPKGGGDIDNWFNREKTQEEKDAWDAYFVRLGELDARKRKGLELFAKHFDHLWD